MQALSVTSDLDSLEIISDYITEAARIAGLDKKASYKLRLAVDEIATNIITYGYNQSSLEGRLDIQADINDHCVTILIKDDSKPYNPLCAPVPDFSLSLEERPIGGLGVFLARTSVDDISYQRINNRNHTTFVVKKAVAQAAIAS